MGFAKRQTVGFRRVAGAAEQRRLQPGVILRYHKWFTTATTFRCVSGFLRALLKETSEPTLVTQNRRLRNDVVSTLHVGFQVVDRLNGGRGSGCA
jgi:hypothetical protein